MPDDATVATPATQEPGSQSGTTPATTPVEPVELTAEQINDKAMDAAFEKHLAPELSGSNAGQKPADAPGSPATGKPEAPAQLTDAQAQTLSRSHMTPEMIAGWDDKQRTDFFANAEKREADQTSGYKKLQEKLADQSQTPEPKPKGEPASTAAQVTPVGDFAESAQKVVDELATTYGDEIKPLGDLTVKLGQTLDNTNQALAQLQASSANKDGLIVQLSIQQAISDLVVDYPSLNKAEARKKVEARFVSDWQSEGNAHRNGTAPLLDRLRMAMTDAAKAEFGTTTETAAQVALANNTKERLTNQPDASDGKARQAPQTQDDIYDQAFEKHLANG